MAHVMASVSAVVAYTISLLITYATTPHIHIITPAVNLWSYH